MRKIIALTLLLALSVSFFSGCSLKKNQGTTTVDTEKIELTYYHLFDDEDIFAPIIKEFETAHPNIHINYKKFTDPSEYLDLIINEMAEGEGPDIFSMQNTWFIEHRKKLTPAPSDLIPIADFENTFVNVAAEDLILPDETGTNHVYGVPLYIDNLALYYNADQFEDAIPSRGKPASTWAELQEDVYKLTKSDNSFERFQVAGIAMGRADNILRAVDIVYLLMIQFGTNFYDSAYTETTFADSTGVGTSGAFYPGVEALAYYTNFAMPSSKYYCWNSYLANAGSEDKEIETFARGKVSMVIGYSYLYEQILAKIDELKSEGQDTISPNAVKVSVIPQFEDPETSTDKRSTYASYFAETVSRTTEHPEEAWEFLTFLANKENMARYHDETHRPASRRDMIEEEQDEAIYGVFASQVGYAESIPFPDAYAYEELLVNAIENVLNTMDPQKALQNAEDGANTYLKTGGLFPVTQTTSTTTTPTTDPEE
ncbi:MAG: extracellular solute-binding protein [Candidatus Gracilibacteria bacterium]